MYSKSKTPSNMSHSNCIKFFTNVVQIVLCLIFLYSVVRNIAKFQGKKIVVAQGMKNTKDITYPSIAMCPFYNVSDISGTRNLTKYYEIIRKKSLIKKNVITIFQPFLEKPG